MLSAFMSWRVAAGRALSDSPLTRGARDVFLSYCCPASFNRLQIYQIETDLIRIGLNPSHVTF